MSSDDKQALSRRQLIALASGAAASGLAGCGGGGGGGGDQAGTPTPTPTPAETEMEGMGVGGTETPTPTPTETAASGAETETETETEGEGGGRKISAHNKDPYPGQTDDPIDPVADIINFGGWNVFDWNGNIFGENPGNGWPSLGVERFINLTQRTAAAKYANVAATEVNSKNSGCTIVYKFREGDHWWDGLPVNARDWVLDHEINKYVAYGPDPSKSTKNSDAYPGAKVELVDDRTVKITRRSPVAVGRGKVVPGGQFAILQGTGNREISVKRDVYGKWLEKLKDASTSDEVSTIASNLRGLDFSIEEVIEKGLGNGMYKPVDWTDTVLTAEKHDGHARSHWTNIDKIRVKLLEDKQKRVEAFKTGKYDAVDPVRTPIRSIIPQVEGYKMIKDFPYFYTRGIKFNFKRDHVNRRGVRRAMAYAMDLKALRKALMSSEGYRSFPQRWQQGIGMASAKYYMGNDWLQNNLIDYGLEPKFDKARQALESEGYSKQKNRWISPEGKPFKATVMGYPIARGVTESQFFTSLMSDFGLSMKVQTITGSQFWQIMDQAHDEIPEMMHLWGPGPYPNGMVAWNGSVLDLPSRMAKPLKEVSFENCPDLSAENIPKPELTQTKSPKYGRPARPKVPAKVGYEGLELPEDTDTYNLIWLDRKIQAAQDFGNLQNWTRKLGWYYNFNMPGFDFYTETWAQSGDVRNFFFGDGSTLLEWQREVEYTIHHGIAQGRAEPHTGPAEGPMAPTENKP